MGATPTSACRAHYRDIVAQSSAVIEQAFESDVSSVLSENHAAIENFEMWTKVLHDSPVLPLIQVSAREYQYGLALLTQGYYRQAFAALRLSLEQGVAAAYFAGHELQLRLWLRGEADISWRAIVIGDDGIFSPPFVRAFSPPLEDEAPHYQAMAHLLYRECSEYVHGNLARTLAMPMTLTFSSSLMLSWHEKAKTARMLIHWALASRFLWVLPSEKAQSLRPALMDELGHLSPIRAFFSSRAIE